MIYKLLPSFQAYAWGDTHYLQQLCNLPEKAGQPLAEMWLGAHPNAPSRLVDDNTEIPLNRFLEADPTCLLGSASSLYHGQLPFLLKILAAQQPLSIQVHPDLFTAEKGFNAENLQGISLGDPIRSFRDDNHKPELLCALTEFTAMCGFRAYPQIAGLFIAFSLQHIWHAFANFSAKQDAESLKELYRQILDSDFSDLQQFLSALEKADCSGNAELEFIKNTCKALHSHHSYDPGIVSPLLLNTFVLQPGQAIFLEAGMIHAYIKGAAVELMANSDNVIRGGLTPKHIDKAMLFAITEFAAIPPKFIEPEIKQNELICYPAPAKEFALAVLNLDGSFVYQSNAKPAIVLCIAGEASTDREIALSQGTAIFVPASEITLTFWGKATLFIASTNV